MKHNRSTYTAEEAKEMADEFGDFDSSPKHLKREILALKKRVTELEKSEVWRCGECDQAWFGTKLSVCPTCGSES